MVDLLSDPERCQVALVTLPEEMPVNEAIEAAFQLEDKVGVALGPVIVNGCYPEVDGLAVTAAGAVALAGVTVGDDLVSSLEAARRFRTTRADLQNEQLERLGNQLPLAQLRVPFLFADAIGPSELDILSDALANGVAALHDPAGASP